MMEVHDVKKTCDLDTVVADTRHRDNLRRFCCARGTVHDTRRGGNVYNIDKEVSESLYLMKKMNIICRLINHNIHYVKIVLVRQ